MIEPADEAGVAEAVRNARAAGTPLRVEGNGTKAGMLRPVQAADTLTTRRLSGVVKYSPNELVVTVRAGTPVTELREVLAGAGQHLTAEPPDMGGGATVGGTVAANLSGPRRVTAGAMRDQVMGIRMVNGSGEALRFGGRVLKNVTGLDLCKLLSGSHGTLGVLTEITLKVLPAPEESGTLVLDGRNPEAAVTALSSALGSPFGVSGAAWVPPGPAFSGPAALVRVEDFSDSVAYRLGRLRDRLGGRIVRGDESRALWDAVREFGALPVREGEAMWRVSVRPSAGPGLLLAVPDARGCLDWGGGLVTLTGDPALHDAVCAAARAARGVWTVLRGPEPMRAAVHVVPPEPPALAAITRRVKAALDPGGILNPGRLYAGL